DISGSALLRGDVDQLKAIGVPDTEAQRLERHISVFRKQLSAEDLATPSSSRVSMPSTSASVSAPASAPAVVKVRTPRRSLQTTPCAA
ncbi:unnamed protein product, partial [Symbiodinium natans]